MNGQVLALEAIDYYQEAKVSKDKVDSLKEPPFKI
jgi:hypothetical protein